MARWLARMALPQARARARRRWQADPPVWMAAARLLAWAAARPAARLPLWELEVVMFLPRVAAQPLVAALPLAWAAMRPAWAAVCPVVGLVYLTLN